MPYNSSSMSDSLQSRIFSDDSYACEFCINTKGGGWEATEGYVGFYWGNTNPVVGVRFYGIK